MIISAARVNADMTNYSYELATMSSKFDEEAFECLKKEREESGEAERDRQDRRTRLQWFLPGVNFDTPPTSASGSEASFWGSEASVSDTNGNGLTFEDTVGGWVEGDEGAGPLGDGDA